jgi:undecaprenyl-diphosphatase
MWRRLTSLVRWVGGHELQVLVGMLIIVLGTWGFLELAGEVTEGDTKAFDARILLALREPGNPHQPIGPQWLHEVVRDFTALGGYAVLILVLLAVTGYLWLERKQGAMLLVVVAIIGGFILSLSLKSVFERERPTEVEALSYVHTSSFPSGHAMMSAVVYLTLGTLLSRLSRSFVMRFYFLAIAVLLTVLVGFSRVFLGVHYPTDVLAGWAAGLVWSTLCWLVARRLQKRGAVEQAT